MPGKALTQGERYPPITAELRRARYLAATGRIEEPAPVPEYPETPGERMARLESEAA